MTNTNTGINFNIFSNTITKYGSDVIRTAVTKTTSNFTGDETLTNGSTAEIRAYIVRKARGWIFDKEGEIEGGDAQMLTKANQTINKNDLITWNNNTYRVQNVLNRDQIGGTVALKNCNLFLIDDE